MKVCWRWGVKDCPVLSYSPVTLQSCYQLSTSLPISSIINERTACLFICLLSIQRYKIKPNPELFCIYILFDYISEMLESTAAVITMVTWAGIPLTGLSMGTAGGSSGGMGTADTMTLTCSPAAVSCMVTCTAVGWSTLPQASVQTLRYG